MHGHKDGYKDLNLKILTSEWDSNPRPHDTSLLYTNVILDCITFNHLYPGKAVCGLFWEREGGGGICMDTRRVKKI